MTSRAVLPACLFKVSCEGTDTVTNAHPDIQVHTGTCTHLHAHTDTHMLAHTNMHAYTDTRMLAHTGTACLQPFYCSELQCLCFSVDEWIHFSTPFTADFSFLVCPFFYLSNVFPVVFEST